MIAMQRVESSNIDAVGHDLNTQTLKVAFQSGGVYEYANVPLEVFQEILQAESVGKTFNRLVKSNPTQYPFVKVA